MISLFEGSFATLSKICLPHAFLWLALSELVPFRAAMGYPSGVSEIAYVVPDEYGKNLLPVPRNSSGSQPVLSGEETQRVLPRPCAPGIQTSYGPSRPRPRKKAILLYPIISSYKKYLSITIHYYTILESSYSYSSSSFCTMCFPFFQLP